MKFLKGDLIFCGASVAVISSFSILLYADFNKKIDAGKAEKIATISFKREVAQRKYQSQVVWEGIEQNSPVYDNDSIRTSERSEAVIHLLDGTDINLEENSMIMLATSGKAININFEHGSISANRGGVSGADIAAINIRSQDATVSIDKSNIQLTQLENSELNLTVSDGTAKVKSSGGETLVKTNEKALISSDRKETKIVQLKFSLAEPAMNRYFLTADQRMEVNFSWGLTGNFSDITLELSSDRLFSKLLVSERVTSQGGARLILEPGVYFWRVAATNSDSRQTEYSDTGKFNVVLRKPVRLISPQHDETVVHSVTQNSVSFKWSEDQLAGDYTLELSRDSEFREIMKSVSTSLKGIVIDNLEEGVYYWRIKSNITLGGEQLTGLGESSSFTISRAKELKPPSLLSPANNERLGTESVRTAGVVMNWNSDLSYTGYVVELASDREFKTVLSSQQRNVNFAEFRTLTAPGRYYWRVKGITGADQGQIISAISEFEIFAAGSIKLISPSDGQVITVPAKPSKQFVHFAWEKAELKGSYNLQISRSSDLSEKKVFYLRDRVTGTVPFDEPGTYYFRVTLTDRKNNEIMKSEIVSFTIKAEEVVPETKTVLIVKSPVKRGRIYINSKFRGYDEVKLDVKPGENIPVRVTASGYNDFNTRLAVNAGETMTFTASMEKSKKLDRVKWVSPVSSSISSAPVYYRDRVVLCSEDGQVIMLTNTGSVIFSKKITRRFESRPAVYEDNIYAVDVNAYLYSISASTGNINWKVKCGGPLLFKSELAVYDSRIYVASGHGIIEAYNLDGKKLWSTDFNESIYNTPLIVKNRMIIATDALTLYSIDISDGDQKWSTTIDERVITLTPLLYNDIIYFGCYSGTFYAVTLDDGDIRWTYKTGGPIYSSPVIVEKNLFFGSEDGTVYSLDSEKGTLIWQFKSDGPVRSSPIHAFGSIVISSDRTLFSLNPQNGGVYWQNTFGSRIKTSPTFAGDTVILGLVNGDVVSVRNNLIELVK